MALAAGCASGPPAPDWQAGGAQALSAFQRLYFSGESTAAEAEFRAARRELGRTGRPQIVARAELFRCAVRTASLEFDDCPGFASLRGDAGAEEVAYAEYLAGRGRHAGSEEPLSRLVGYAVQLRRGGITPHGIAAAVDIASAQGWRRPLLSWLSVQLKRAEEADDAEAAARLRRRLDLVSEQESLRPR